MGAIATLKIEFTCGDMIRDAFKEAIRLAGILNVYIEFEFNGITCVCNKNTFIDDAVKSYNQSIDCNSKIAFA